MKVSDGQNLTLDHINKCAMNCGACDSELVIEPSECDTFYGFLAYADCDKCKVQYEMRYDSVTVKAVDF